ncbi:MAG: Hsp20/alpha crystallin family protein [Planctomycetes bacterium]|nr:Hsp20/alpha crystallin family protein [Planctomycetota bacterium]
MKLLPSLWRAPALSNGDAVEKWFDQFFQGPFGNRLPEAFRETNLPPLNVAEDENRFSVSVELPGLDEKDINVQLMGNQLTISGEKKFEEEKKGKEFHRIEAQYGAFSRTVTLPSAVRSDGIEAIYRKGVLTINVPKTQVTPSAKVKIKSE